MSEDPITPLELAPLTAVERRFLQDVHTVISKNIQRADFDVRDAAELMSVSKRTLERKMKRVTGKTPGLYIREMRMQMASRIAQEGEVPTVNKLAQSVGFRDPDHFSRLYRRTFGMSPAELFQ